MPLIEEEFYNYVQDAPAFRGASGIVEIMSAMSQIVIFTASRSLQGNEVRDQLNSTFAKYYHDLDMGESYSSYIHSMYRFSAVYYFHFRSTNIRNPRYKLLTLFSIN